MKSMRHVSVVYVIEIFGEEAKERKKQQQKIVIPMKEKWELNIHAASPKPYKAQNILFFSSHFMDETVNPSLHVYTICINNRTPRNTQKPYKIHDGTENKNFHIYLIWFPSTLYYCFHKFSSFSPIYIFPEPNQTGKKIIIFSFFLLTLFLSHIQGQTVQHNQRIGIIVSSGDLALQNVTRHHAGNYTCIASNVEGDGESNTVELKIMCKY